MVDGGEAVANGGGDDVERLVDEDVEGWVREVGDCKVLHWVAGFGYGEVVGGVGYDARYGVVDFVSVKLDKAVHSL